VNEQQDPRLMIANLKREIDYLKAELATNGKDPDLPLTDEDKAK
jgi:hypothetical protein